MDKVYLGSQSPRRAELLKLLRIPFELIDFNLQELQHKDEAPLDYSTRITQEKLEAAWLRLKFKNYPLYPVICADTEVIVQQKIYGKPQNYEEAFNMLKSYSSCSHQVITSVGVKFQNFNKIQTNITQVYFDELMDEDIHEYLSLNEYQDKAGGYGIQGYLAQYIQKIEGCYYSVVGLPLNSLRLLLKELSGISF